MLTLSQKRKGILSRHTDKKIHMIGINIAYVDEFLTDMQKEKEKAYLGRNLLVFPMHSTATIDLDYNIQDFIREIKQVAKDFDSVRVCMYWKDLLRGQHLPYANEGFEIVSAGHSYDRSFLPRLKSIISCADMIMSNDMGSFIGQGIYMNKACYIYRQHYTYSTNEMSEEYELRKSDNDYNQLFKIFGTGDNYITREQREFANYLFGLNEVKTPQQMNQILEQLEMLYKESRNR